MQDRKNNGAKFDKLRALLRSARARTVSENDELPLRAQPFSTEEMEQLGGRLARTHRLSATRGPDLLLARLGDNQRVLGENCARLATAVRAQRRLTPAGEWLLDNAHLIEEQMRTARRHLPRDYSRELPRLVAGPSFGLPRVYDLALEAISHGDGRVDADSLHRFVAAYQTVAPLRLGELWAIPIMLRLALIENLRRVSARVAQDRVERDIADDWADRMLAIAEADPKSLVMEIADMARSNPPQSSSFVAEIARRLQGQSSVLAAPLSWIEQWLADAGQSIEQMVQGENQQQAADQVSISNSIGSLRFLSMMDWRVFVEAQSLVERTLEQDPCGAYSRMDFATRDTYRHAVEALAKRSRRTEAEVAQASLSLAQAGVNTATDAAPIEVSTHVGYYLIDAGRPELEQRLGLRQAFRLRNAQGRVPLTVFLAPIALLTIGMSAALLEISALQNSHASALVLAGLLAFMAFSEAAMALTNWATTRLARPSALPRMNYARGLAPEARTLVVVPTMLSSTDAIGDLVELLEVRFLANRDAHLHFALLTDFLDAEHEHEPGDAVLLDFAQSSIESLNAKYPALDAGASFYLFHRPRRFNARQERWMGHERKRGKLAELNALLRCRDDARARFQSIVGDVGALTDVEYVITLDSDTQLPRDSAREFVATLAHPLNRPHFERENNSIARGYAILQPRVGVSLAGGPRTRYAELYGSEPGIDPYTRAVSDVYQDLFDEGSFVGKGIYVVDAFERALAGRFPDNSVLSHDLLEGCFARAGLVSDVQLYEDYPASYALDVNRRHRWIRGDWQLLPWLLPRVPREDGTWSRNPLGALSRWKLLDNLRRSLVAPATTALLLLGWALAVRPGMWTLWILATLLLQPTLAALVDLFSKPEEMPLTAHLAVWGRNASATAQRALLGIACLPFEAAFGLDAIGRTLWRLLVSRRRLLEWQPSSEAQRSVGRTLGALFLRMASAPIIAVIAAVALALQRPGALLFAAPLLLLWAFAPWLMWHVSCGVPRQSTALRTGQALFLRRLARRTWFFFETWVGAENNDLPPDNVQHRPQTKVAHRTSPTNIGLSLLANLAAHDFGYLTRRELLARTTATLATLDKLPRHRGHFFNWYDTQTLAPLLPEYVSTVDSGNLAGHLLTLRQGLLELLEPAANDARILRGLADTVDVLMESAGGAGGTASRQFAADVHAMVQQPPASAALLLEQLGSLRSRLPRVVSELAGATEETGDWLVALRRGIEAAQDEAAVLSDEDTTAQRGEIERLATRLEAFARMEFDFLYDPARHLLAIGYHVADRRLDSGCYDLLASEARLASFVAIAQGQLPQETWFALGRLLNGSDGAPVLLSWSGSMFEYLMPQLVMPSYPGTLLDETARAAVERQIAYANRRGVAWGISESGYNTVDAQMNYQYRAFGVPSLGLQRGLAQELVIAPYASMLAVMVDPVAACSNLERLVAEGVGGRFGLFEAVDHTAARLPPGDTRAIVYSHMAHHQGMGLLALAYALLDQPMQRRFTADPSLQATLLLLQERIPRTATFHSHASELPGADVVPDQVETRLRVFHSADAGLPAVQMLSNGRYHVMVSSAGGGYSRLREMAITRWREDVTRDHWGSFCYLRDVATGNFWSTALQPTGIVVEGYEAIFSDAKAEFRGRRENYDTHFEIAVSPEHDIELRRLRITNRARTRRTIEITSYAEVVLAPAIADELHPAFSNLFVQTMLVPDKQAIVCTRRARASDEAPLWMLHLIAVHDADIDEISYETDRARFVGRGSTLAAPAALMDAASRLSNAQGSVLDPIVAIRCRITLAPEQTVTLDIVTGVSEDAVGCHGLIDKYRDRRLADRVFDLAWTHSQVVRRQLNATQADAQLYERLAGLVIYNNPAMRAERSLQLLNRRGQSGLWAHAISGDFPIVLLKIADTAHIDLVRQMVHAHAYWRLKGLAVDLVIWNEDQAGYRQQLNDQIMGLIAAGLEAHVVDRPGGIFVRPVHQMSNEDRILLQVTARVIVSDARGSLAEQLNRRRPADPPLPRATQPLRDDTLFALRNAMPTQSGEPALAPLDLVFDNGLGGFSKDGREYVITTTATSRTPAPWSNVIANPGFGTVLSESAIGYTWCENAHEYRLTPWLDDPVIDQGGEAFYLRDEDSGRVWSPSALPCRGNGEYRTRHGFGYSVFEHIEDSIESELTVFVAVDAPVKFSVLKLRNRSHRPRRLSTVGYVEWVLGDLRAKTQSHVVTELDPECGAVYARNAYNTEFEGRVGFYDVDSAIDARSVTCDRGEFIGRHGSLGSPAAMGRVKLSGRVGAGFDACAAFGVTFELAPDEEREVVFRLGSGRNAGDATRTARSLRGREAAQLALAAVHAFWHDALGAIQVHTPEPAVDLLANGWLMYQTIACRFMARSGYYQSGGAYGFRDQLQDAMAMLHADPARVRAHLLLCAAHQFVEGDVQHWWHPPQDRGVRTRCSDDFLWLPLAASRYASITGDLAVFAERVHYIEGRALNFEEESYYDQPVRSSLSETLYQHCQRAIERGLSLLGARGLPLMASGDWNDGMNRVGIEGRGESVWLGFFLYEVLGRFSDVAAARDDWAFADRCLDAAQQLRKSLEEHAWDGEWYRRAWFDNGTPLGSRLSDECRIDSISQSWAVLSGAADPARAQQAMTSLEHHLVQRDAGLIKLLDPPFDLTAQDPGYIRGYVPGVRENGGQYTHAAVWTTMAFAQMGDPERAWELLRMIMPIAHGSNAAQVATYKVEPYVVAADVYAVEPHIGRGGWTWYTGSAGWMYRLIVESLLGVQRRGATLTMTPCIPREWPSYRIDYRFGSSLYRIEVTQSANDSAPGVVTIDGIAQTTGTVPLIDDGKDHGVAIALPPPAPAPAPL